MRPCEIWVCYLMALIMSGSFHVAIRNMPAIVISTNDKSIARSSLINKAISAII